MELDLLIRGGRVMDPARGVDRVGDIGVRGNRIVEADPGCSATQTIDATGLMVVPGLIDFHTHLFHGVTSVGVYPHRLPALGVTAAVDAGSCGGESLPLALPRLSEPGMPRVKVQLSCDPLGMARNPEGHEDFDPALFDAGAVRELMAERPGLLIGLKIRVSRFLMRDISPLRAALALAERVGLPLCVHVTDPAADLGEVADMLRGGDILCHVYHGKGSAILDGDGNVRAELLAARKRGVVMDVAKGHANYSHRVARAALARGFPPDVISTDLTQSKFCYGLRAPSLPFVMSQFLAMGMELADILRCVTETPAALMGMSGEIGTLAPGALADVTLLRRTKRVMDYEDAEEAIFTGSGFLTAAATVLDGEIAYAESGWREGRAL